MLNVPAMKRAAAMRRVTGPTVPDIPVTANLLWWVSTQRLPADYGNGDSFRDLTDNVTWEVIAANVTRAGGINMPNTGNEYLQTAASLPGITEASVCFEYFTPTINSLPWVWCVRPGGVFGASDAPAGRRHRGTCYRSGSASFGFSASAGGAAERWVAQSGLTANQKTFVVTAVSSSNSRLKIFVNGVKAENNHDRAYPAAEVNRAKIGQINDLRTAPDDGEPRTLNHCAQWARELTDQEAADLYSWWQSIGG